MADFTYDFTGGSSLAREPVLTMDDWLGQRRRMAELRASSVLTQAPTFNPDSRAKDLQLLSEANAQLGVNLRPQNLTDDLRANLMGSLEQQRAQRVLQTDERVAQFLADPVNAEVSYDDLSTLGFWGGLVNAVGRGGDAVFDGARFGVQRRRLVNRLARLDNVDKSLLDIYRERSQSDSAQERTGAIGSSIQSYFAAQLEGLFTSDAEEDQARAEVRAQLQALFVDEALEAEERVDAFGGSAGFERVQRRFEAQNTGREGVLGGFVDLYELAAESPTDFLGWAVQVAAESVPGVALAAAVGVATRGAGLQSAVPAAAALGVTSGVRAEAGNFAELAQDLGYDLTDPAQVRRLLEEPQVVARMSDQAFTYGATVGLFDAFSGGVASQVMARSPVGEFMLQMVSQAALGSGGELFGRVFSEQEVDWREVILEGVIELLTGPLEVAGVAGRTAYGRVQAARDTEERRTVLQAISEASGASKLRERAAAKYGEFVQRVTADGPIETLHIDATRLDEMLKQSGTSPEQFAQLVPGFDTRAFAEAVEVGGDVQVPTSAYAANIVGTELEQPMAQHIRFKALEMSLAEAKELQAELETKLTDVTKDIETTRRQVELVSAEGQAAYERLTGELRQAGRAPGVAEKEALLLIRGLETRAKRAGISVTEALRRYGTPRVRSAEVNTGGNEPTNAMTYARAQELVSDTGPAVSTTTLALRRALSEIGADGEPSPAQVRQAVRLAASRGEIGVPLADEFYVDPEDTLEPVIDDPATLFQTIGLRRGEETLADYGLVLAPGEKPTVRAVALAMQRRQRKLYGRISRTARGPKTVAKMAQWMAEEVAFELSRKGKDSAVGWYTTKYQAALDRLGDAFPELLSDRGLPRNLPLTKFVRSRQDARDLMTMIVAVTSNGTRAADNFRNAAEAYRQLRENGRFQPVQGSGDRAVQINSALNRIVQLVSDFGSVGAARDFLLEELTVKEYNARAKAAGVPKLEKVPATMRVPMAAGVFGPKLGAFYANLSGREGYLTMDLWWTRTINRYRGDVLPEVPGLGLITEPGKEPVGLQRFKHLIGRPEITDKVALNYVTEYAQVAIDKKYKGTTEAEKAANTLYKLAFVKLAEAPEGAGDRGFMLEVAEAARRRVFEMTGTQLTVADLQAVIWYYEKRLYADMGTKERGDISYEEAADRAVRAIRQAREPEPMQAPLFQSAPPSETAAFQAWFGDSKVVDESGKPLVVYRGEHGPTSDGRLQTRLGSLTFTADVAVANTYAQSPNDSRDRGRELASRVIPAYLRIERPLVNDPRDPFVDASLLIEALGEEVVFAAMRRNAGYLTGTNLWEEQFSDEFFGIDDLLDQAPERAGELYFDIFPLLDDAEFVAAAVAAGYDGAIYDGTGEASGAVEYRVFDTDQVRSAFGGATTLFQSAPPQFTELDELARAEAEEQAAFDALPENQRQAAWSARREASMARFGQRYALRAQLSPADRFLFDIQRNPADLDLPSYRPHWFVVTATQERFGDGTAPENVALNAQLKAKLDELGMRYVELQGVYLGQDQGLSFLVYRAPEPDLPPFGKTHGEPLGALLQQESILDYRGLVYTDGSGRLDVPYAGVMTGDEARAQDFLSVILPDGQAFSMNLQWPMNGGIGSNPNTWPKDTYYGLALDEQGRIEMVHWSGQPLDVIDPAKAGTGPLYGDERRMAQGFMGSFYGLNVGMEGGYRKEGGLGRAEHRVSFDPKRLYPIEFDPENLRAGLDASQTPQQQLAAYEAKIIAAGYDGYFAIRGPLGATAKLAIPLQPRAVNPEIFYQGGPAPIFKSALAAAVGGAKQKQALPRDWLAIIPKLPGFKQAEFYWTGLWAHLETLAEESPKRQVTRDELVGFVWDNWLEVNVSEQPETNFEEWTEVGKRKIEPGRANTEYREVLLLAPGLENRGANAARADIELVANRNHFDEHNVVAHYRSTDFVQGNKRVVLLEEVQSDLATKWRKNNEGHPAIAELLRRERMSRPGSPGDIGAAAAELKAWTDKADGLAGAAENADLEVRDLVIRRAQDLARAVAFNRGLSPASTDRIVQAIGGTWSKFGAILRQLQGGGLNPAVAGEQYMFALEQSRQKPGIAGGDLSEFAAMEAVWYAAWDKITERDDAMARVIAAQAAEAYRAKMTYRAHIETRKPVVPDPAEVPFTYTPFPGDDYVALAAKAALRDAIDRGADALLWTPASAQGERYNAAVGEVVERVESGWLRTVETIDGTFALFEFHVDGRRHEVEYDSAGRVRRATVDAQGATLGDLFGEQVAQGLLGLGMPRAGMPVPKETLQAMARSRVEGEGYTKVYDRLLRKFFAKWAEPYGGTVTVDETTLTGKMQRDWQNAERERARQALAEAVREVAPVSFTKAAVLDRLEQDWPSILAAAVADPGATLNVIVKSVSPLTERLVRQIRVARENIAKRQLRLATAEADGDALNVSVFRQAIADAEAFIARAEAELNTLGLLGYTSELGTALAAQGDARLATLLEEADYRPSAEEREEAVAFLRMFGVPVSPLLEKAPDVIATPRAYWRLEITDQMREAAREGFTLFQRRNNTDPRGAIVLPPEGGSEPDLYLFDRADLSTVLHEGGHYFLWLLQRLANDGDASAAAELDVLRGWWASRAEDVAKDAGVPVALVRRFLAQGTTGDAETDRAVNVGMHEQFARGFEAYLFEGKAPSNGLREVFESFAAWLMSIYRTVTGLNVTLTDEVRGVFDRLLALDDEIDTAQATAGADDELFLRTAQAAGVDPEQARRLAELSREARDEARQLTLAAIMEPIARERRKEVQAARAKLTERVTEEVNAKPHNRVIELLGNQRWLGGDIPEQMRDTDLRLDRAILLAEGYDPERLPRGRRAIVANGTGVAPDELAGLFGYASGAAMIDDLLTQPRAAAEVKQRVDALLEEQFGPDRQTDTIPQTALDALHGEKRGQLIVAELRALSRLGSRDRSPTTRSQAYAIAREMLARMPAREATASERFLAAERRQAEQATRLLATGDIEGAITAKRMQLIQHALYGESRKADQLVGKLERLAGRLRKRSVRKNLAGDYLDAIDDILDTYDFRRMSGSQEQRRGALLAYVDRMRREGRENELAIPDHVLQRAQRTPYRTLPMRQIEGVYDSLRNIEHTARMKQKLRDARAERELTAIVDDIAQAFTDNIKGRTVPRVDGRGNRIRNAVREYVNLILNTDTILRRIDGWRMGAVYRAIKAPIDAAEAQARDMRVSAAERMEQLYAPYAVGERASMAVSRVWDGHPEAFSKWDLISLALNWGNKDNRERVTSRDSRGRFTPEQVEALLENLDERDWKFVQSVWDYIDEFWPMIAERERRTTGVTPKKVEATEVETRFGTFRGGYYPIRYDPRFSATVVEETHQELMSGMMAGRFGKAQTRNGHTKDRAAGGGGRTVQLGMQVFHGHVAQVIHDLAFSEPVNNAWRILQDGRVKSLFEQNGMIEDHQSLEVWLQDTATGQIMTAGVLGRAARHLKAGFTLSKLAFNMGTVALQVTGFAQTAAALGKRDTAIGFGKYIAGGMLPVAARIKARSQFMADRETTFNRDIYDLLNNTTDGPLAGPVNRLQNLLMRLGFYAMMKVQFYVIDAPTWVTAYEAAVRRGATDEEAGLEADRLVARAQASGLWADRSAIERGTLSRGARQNDFVRLFTALGSYMFAKFNIATEVVGKTRQGMRQGGVKGALALGNGVIDLALLFTVEAVLAAVIRRSLPGDDDEDERDPAAQWAIFLARETALSAMGTLPFIRDISGALQGFGGGGAYGGVMETMARPLVTLADEDLNKADAKAAINAIGLAVPGVPSVAVNRVIEAELQRRDGEDIGVLDYILGVPR